ncbi:hypothetical protein PUN28_002729 [Cardiocondyla obscurior]|uniref:Uncharacterized protein n=1 Tax=Cardiocondyla obscurior TaxID=286306 RepID=A0AAW2GVU4_9HYME
MGSPVTVAPGKPTVPASLPSSNSGIVSSESESVAEPRPTSSTLVGSELAALSSSVNSGIFNYVLIWKNYSQCKLLKKTELFLKLTPKATTTCSCR